MLASTVPTWFLIGGLAASGTATSSASDPVEEIVVEGTPMPEPNLAPPPQQAIDLENRPLRFETLGDVVSELPGVALFRQGGLGASQFLSIRGADFDQTVVLIDDVPVTGPDRGAIDLSLFPVDGFSRVEIFRGSAPIRYGVGTIGGVIRLVPKEASSRTVSARGSVGSFATQEARAEAEGWSGPFGLVAAGGALRSENDFVYLNENATLVDTTDDELLERENAGVRQGHGYLMGTWTSGNHRLALLGFALHQDRGLPGPVSVISRESAQQRTRVFGSLGYRLQSQVDETPVDVFATAALGYDLDRVQDPLGRVGRGREDTRDAFLSVETRAGAFVGLWPGLTLGATTFYRRDDIRPNDRFASPGDQPSSRDLAVGAGEITYRTLIDAVELSLRGSISAQFTQARLTSSELQDTMVRELDRIDPNYRLEARVRPWRLLELSGQLSSGTKLPTTLQLFGNRDTVVESPDLEPESSLTADVGMQFKEDWGDLAVRAEARWFWLRVEDIIVARRTAQNTVAFRNEREGETQGVEGSLAFRLGAHLEGTTALTYLDSSFDNSGFENEQPLRVPFRLFQRLSWRFPFEALEWWAELDHRSGFFADSANEVRQPPLSFVHAGFRATSEDDGLSVAVSVRNLFDARGLDLLAFPRPGRAFEIALQWNESL